MMDTNSYVTNSYVARDFLRILLRDVIILRIKSSEVLKSSIYFCFKAIIYNYSWPKSSLITKEAFIQSIKVMNSFKTIRN